MSVKDNVPISITDSVDEKGSFKRKPVSFTNKVTVDGSSGFKAEANRYHLYVSLACPWAHRTLIVRRLKGLESIISVSVVHYLMGGQGWTFNKDEEGLVSDDVNHATFMREVYLKADPNYSARITVPVLWDKQKNTIVCNESADIIRMLNSEFNEFAKHPEVDLYPEELRSKIDEVNAFVYPNVNDGVYRCGFAQTQEAYDHAYHNLFNALDQLDVTLSKSRYLVGNRLTEADVRLFTTLIRFDAVYSSHFKCNKKQLREYPSLLGYVQDLYQNPFFHDTVNFKHIKNHYFMSHTNLNPSRIVPNGPDLKFFDLPHKRENIN